jgi:hypothetical protein
MTTGELIEKLKQADPDGTMQVVVDGYEGGLDDPIVRFASMLVPSTHYPHEGKYEEEYMTTPEGKTVVCVSRG